MSHEIYREKMLANDGKPAWHGLGVVRETVQYIAEAVRELLGNIRYSLEPAATFNPESGLFELLDEQYNVIMRDPGNTERQTFSFGQVSKDFRMADPLSLAEALDPVCGEYPVATAGMLRNGSSIFVALDGGTREIVGEEHQNFLTFDLSVEPGRTVKAYSTEVRTVCRNTQAAGLAAASLRFDISHTGNIEGKVAFAVELLKSLEERKAFFETLMEAYAKYNLNTAEVTAVIEAAHPLPKRPKILSQTIDQLEPADMAKFRGGAIEDLLADLTDKERAYVNSVARATSARELVRSNFVSFNSVFPHFAGSAYALYNAITQTSDWRDGRGNVAESVAIGPRFREKIRAAEMLTDLVGLN